MEVTRRRFCLVAAAFPALARVGQPQGEREPRGYYGGFRLAIASECFGNAAIERVAGQASALGLKYLALSPAQADLAEIGTAELRRLRAKLLDAGLSVHDYGVWQLRGKPRGKRTRRELEAVFQRAEEFGFETLILAPDAPLWNDIERLAQRYRVYVAAINRPDGYKTADALAQAVAGRGDLVGAAIDTGRLVSAGQSPAQAVAKLKTRLFAVHLSDVTAAGGFCPLGQGSVDFPALFKALTEAGYDDLITVTCDGFAQNAEALADSLEYLKKITGGK